MPDSRRIARSLLPLCAVAGVAGGLTWGAGSPIGICRGLRSGQDFDALVPCAAGLMAWIGLGWFAAAMALEAIATVPGCCGRACGSIAARITPRLVRRIAQAAIGVSVLAGPLAAGSATAVGRPAGPTISAVQVDRPVAARDLRTVAPSPSPVAAPDLRTVASSPSPAPALPSAKPVPFNLDRPDTAPPQGFVASPPAMPARQTPPGPAALAAGAVHRDNNLDAYVVRRGDALWDIASRHLGPHATAADIAREWPRWYAANRDVIGPDPGVIRPGELLRPPA